MPGCARSAHDPPSCRQQTAPRSARCYGPQWSGRRTCQQQTTNKLFFLLLSVEKNITQIVSLCNVALTDWSAAKVTSVTLAILRIDTRTGAFKKNSFFVWEQLDTLARPAFGYATWNLNRTSWHSTNSECWAQRTNHFVSPDHWHNTSWPLEKRSLANWLLGPSFVLEMPLVSFVLTSIFVKDEGMYSASIQHQCLEYFDR